MRLRLRPANPEDAAALGRLERDLAQTPGLLAVRPHEVCDERLAARLLALRAGAGGQWLGAEVDDRLVGHGVLEPMPLEVTRHVVVLTLAVARGWHRRGLGRALLKALLAWARAEPAVERVELRVRASNAPAVALYEALGFVVEGRLRGRIRLGPGQYVDDLAMGLWVGR
ncbi:MAG: GNAT family N-acetyltransferase [Myxococcaceae bacterium]|jgi:RimJ/RimL family protein N-acetyltransferase|nr:GNAT family N-acetyltransferase [Myxococcaceae bacterium]